MPLTHITAERHCTFVGASLYFRFFRALGDERRPARGNEDGIGGEV